MVNDLNRFHLVMNAIDRVPNLGSQAEHLRWRIGDARVSCRAHTRREGEDPSDVDGWTWPRS